MKKKENQNAFSDLFLARTRAREKQKALKSKIYWFLKDKDKDKNRGKEPTKEEEEKRKLLQEYIEYKKELDYWESVETQANDWIDASIKNCFKMK